MAKRGFELNTRITATDDASKVVDGVAKKVEALEDETHEVDIDADADKAESKVKALDRRLDNLTAEDRVAVLKANTKQAQREVDALTRKLANADKYDDEEIKLIVTARDQATKKLQGIQDELGEIQNEAKETGQEMDAEMGDASSGILSKFSNMKASMIAGFGAIGAAASVAFAAMKQEWDRQAGLRQIEGEFRLTADKVEQYGKVAADLYANHWGDSMQEVQRNAALTGERLKGVTDDMVGEMTAQGMAISQVFGVEFTEVIRSTNQLLENDLANSAQHAFDIITTGLQDGANEAGDFFDSIDEYAQHLDALGLSGEDALNMMVHGLQNGQRDTDKLMDAVKEFRLRAVSDVDEVSDAYRGLGFNADDMRDKVAAGGPSAKKAFLEVLAAIESVEDPVEQTELAVALLGTQYEDLGPKGVDSLQAIAGATREVDGATKDLEATVEATPWEELQRGGVVALGWLGDAIDGVILKGDNLTKDTEEAGDTFVYESGRMAGSAREVGDAYAGVGDSIGLTADELVELKAAADPTWEQHLEDLKELDGIADGASGSFAEMEAAASGAADGVEEVTDEVDDLTDSFERLKGEMDIRDAWDNVVEGALNFEDAVKAAEDAEKEFGAGSREAAAANREMESTLRDRVRGVINYIETTENIPPEKITEIKALLDQGSVDEAEAELAKLERHRTMVLTLKTRIRNAPSSDFAIPDPHGSGNKTVGAAGGIINRPTLLLAGEAGPEALVPLHRTPGNGPLPTGGFGGGPTFTTIIQGSIVGVDDWERKLNERDNRILAMLNDPNRLAQVQALGNRLNGR